MAEVQRPEKGSKWRRRADGEMVTIKKVMDRTVRYQFSNGGSMVTRTTRFLNLYEPVKESKEQSSGSGVSSPSAGPDDSGRAPTGKPQQ